MSFLSRHVTLILVGLPLFVLFGMLVLFEIGRAAGIRRSAREPERALDGLGPVKGAVFGLLGLLIAFTFAGAAGRYDKRRDLAVREAVAIGNAWDRLAVLPTETRSPLRDGLRRYVESRLETYRRLPDFDAAMAELQRSRDLEDGIWREAVAASATQHVRQVTLLILPALETSFDMSRVRTETAMHHPPMLVWVMLLLLSLASALIAGYGVTSRSRGSWLYVVAFAASTAIAVYAILDIEFPRAGLVRLDASERPLTEVLERMK